MKEFSYKTRGTCSTRIDIILEDDNVIRSVKFTNGCNGNTQGVAKLAEGRPAEEIISLLKGISCGGRPTSCPDQLSKALELAIAESN